MNLVETRGAELVGRLQILPGPAERLAVLVERADRLPALAADERNDGNLVPGCVSRVWLTGEACDGKMRFRGDADSRLVKGLVTLLWEIAHGQPPAELAAAPEAMPVIAELGLADQLSPTRLAGLRQVWRRMREISNACVAGRAEDVS